MKLAGLLLPQIIGARRLDRPVGEWTPAVLVRTCATRTT
jgi:hypothetical protein